MKKALLLILILVAAALLYFSYFPFSTKYSKADEGSLAQASAPVQDKPQVAHISTPEPLKGVYMTACIASLPQAREKIVDLIGQTELNAIVIDIKDYTGTVSFTTGDPTIDSIKGTGCFVKDMQDFVKELHEKNIYVIGRVTVFQDPLYTKLHPEVAVKSKSKHLPDGSQAVWKDHKGLAFIDVGAKQYWDHVIAIATSSYAAGFDEINFDYIRFPSDGDMSDADYTYDVGLSKSQAVRKFWEYLSSNLSGTGLKTSADLFGLTTVNDDDLGIGQVLEYALENFDYVAPMVYPSHYANGFNGWPDPNKVPYDVVHYSMTRAVARDKALLAEVSTTTVIKSPNGEISTTSPDLALMKRVNPGQLRPWLQDFNYPVTYTSDMVKTQMKATYDAGLTSWLLWDPANTYTEAALIKE